MNTFEMNQASIMGREAFNNGQKCIPCLDKNLMSLIRTGSTSASILMDQWLKAWHNENLKQ